MATMNEPPPPYEVRTIRTQTNDRHPATAVVCGDKLVWTSPMSWQAISIRDILNAAYMQGWRDRDEQEQDDG